MRDDDVVKTPFGHVEYWIAWQEEDNPEWRKNTLLRYRVWRDEVSAPKAVPITEAMSKEEAEQKLYEIQLLLGGIR